MVLDLGLAGGHEFESLLCNLHFPYLFVGYESKFGLSLSIGYESKFSVCLSLHMWVWDRM